MSTPFGINANALTELLKQSAEYTSSENIYLKMTQGVHQLRLCPPWSSEGTPCRMLYHHSGFQDKDGNKKLPLCYDYVFNNIPTIGKVLNEQKLIKQNDVDVYRKIKCIFCRVGEIIKNMQGKAANQTYPKKRYMWNIIDRKDGKNYVWGTSDTVFKNLLMFYSAYPALFNVDSGLDLSITATGEKLQRKYMIQVINNPTPLNYPVNEIHNLDIVMGEGYKNMNEAIELIMSSYPNMLQLLGINPAEIMIGDNPPF